MANDIIQWFNIIEAADFLQKNYPDEKWYPQKIQRHISVNLQPPPYQLTAKKKKRFFAQDLLDWKEQICDKRLSENRMKS